MLFRTTQSTRPWSLIDPVLEVAHDDIINTNGDATAAVAYTRFGTRLQYLGSDDSSREPYTLIERARIKLRTHTLCMQDDGVRCYLLLVC